MVIPYVGIHRHRENAGAAFTLETVCDNRVMASVSSVFFDSKHPLAGNRQRLDRVVDIMFRRIQKTLFAASGGRSFTEDQLLEGGAVTAGDVLREALAALLQYPPGRLTGTWEALAVEIAHNKAVDAYRASQKGLRGTERRDRLYLVSGDAERAGPDGEMQAPLFEVLTGDWDGPEVECERVERALAIVDLAREVLEDRERKIVFAIIKGRTRKEVGEELGLTSQRVGQIFLDAMKRLETDPSNPFTSEDMKERGDA